MDNSFFSQLKSELAQDGQTVGKMGQLHLIGIISRVLGLFLLIFTTVLCVMAFLAFCAVAAINALAFCMPVWAAALIVGAAYLLLLFCAIICRKAMFINPFIRLLSKQLKSEDELTSQLVETEHQLEMQQVRMECQVENATREFDFYVNLITRGWRVFKALLKKKA